MALQRYGHVNQIASLTAFLASPGEFDYRRQPSRRWRVIGLKVLKVKESRRNLVALPLNGGFIVR